MDKKLLLVAALIGVGLFWSALAAEITLRFLSDNFIALFILVFLSCLCSGLIVYRLNVRIPTARADTGRSAQRSRNSNRSRPQSNRQQRTESSAGGSGERGKQPQRSRNNQRSQGARRSRRTPARMKGRVKSYSSRQAYGFVIADSGEQAFFHKTNLDSSVDEQKIKTDTPVTFEMRKGDRGPIAVKIRIAD